MCQIFFLFFLKQSVFFGGGGDAGNEEHLTCVEYLGRQSEWAGSSLYYTDAMVRYIKWLAKKSDNERTGFTVTASLPSRSRR